MKGIGLLLLLGGWAVAVGGLLMSDATGMRMAMALIGFGTSAGGIFALNSGHLENAIWKTRRG